MRDIHIHKHRMGLRSAGDVFKGPDGKEGEGEVGKCGHWDSEYDRFGFCRDDQCRRNRMDTALRTGKATRLRDGTVVWLVEGE